MLPMTKQVQIACDTAKGVVARLAGVDIPVFEDNEKTLADLKTRIAKTIAFIKSVNQAQIDGTEDKEIVIKRGDKETRYNGMRLVPPTASASNATNEAGVSLASLAVRDCAGCRRSWSASKSSPCAVTMTISPSMTQPAGNRSSSD